MSDQEHAPIHWLGDCTDSGDLWELTRRRDRFPVLGNPTTLYFKMDDGTNILVPSGWWIYDWHTDHPRVSSAAPAPGSASPPGRCEDHQLDRATGNMTRCVETLGHYPSTPHTDGCMTWGASPPGRAEGTDAEWQEVVDDLTAERRQFRDLYFQALARAEAAERARAALVTSEHDAKVRALRAERARDHAIANARAAKAEVERLTKERDEARASERRLRERVAWDKEAGCGLDTLIAYVRRRMAEVSAEGGIYDNGFWCVDEAEQAFEVDAESFAEFAGRLAAAEARESALRERVRALAEGLEKSLARASRDYSYVDDKGRGILHGCCNRETQRHAAALRALVDDGEGTR